MEGEWGLVEGVLVLLFCPHLDLELKIASRMGKRL